jgi:hypothetical protein
MFNNEKFRCCCLTCGTYMKRASTWSPEQKQISTTTRPPADLIAVKNIGLGIPDEESQSVSALMSGTA